MITKKIAAGIAVLGLATAPVMAQVAPSIAPVSSENELGGDSSFVALGLLAGIVAIAVLAVADDDDEPVSA